MAVVSEAAQPSARVPEAGQDSSGRRGRCSAFLFLADKKKAGPEGPAQENAPSASQQTVATDGGTGIIQWCRPDFD